MGIRFYCPQGHKLNVKSFLAGKKGICPHCNAKVDIPLTSTRRSDKADKAADRAARAVPTGGPTPRAAAAPTTALPMARPVTEPSDSAPMALLVHPSAPASAAAPAPSTPAGGMSAATPPPGASLRISTTPARAVGAQAGLAGAQTGTPSVPIGPAPARREAAPTPGVDAIAQSPHAVWYVRPASGGQYGPATGDIMRQWIDEGRVAPESLVWHEGWPGWRQAITVFPQLSGGATGVGALPGGDSALAGSAAALAMLEPISSEPAGASRRTERQRSNVLAITIVVLLSLVVIALGVFLFWLMSR